MINTEKTTKNNCSLNTSNIMIKIIDYSSL